LDSTAHYTNKKKTGFRIWAVQTHSRSCQPTSKCKMIFYTQLCSSEHFPSIPMHFNGSVLQMFLQISQSMYHDVNIHDPIMSSFQIQAQMCARVVSEREWPYLLIKTSLSSLGIVLDIYKIIALFNTHTSSPGLIYSHENCSNPHDEMSKISDTFMGEVSVFS
jgi:hypothetical protein